MRELLAMTGDRFEPRVAAGQGQGATLVGPLRAAGGPNDPGKGGGNDDGRTDIVTKTRPKTKKPSLYKVLLLNDDYTPMEFVVEVLQVFFALPRERATQIMLKVHTEGRGVCGIYPKDVASSKVEQVTAYSREHQHPLQCAMEET